MNITELAIKRKIVTYTIIILLIFAGVSAYFDMEKAEDPGFLVKTATVTTVWPGASTEQMRELVSKEIEKIVQDIEELDFVETKNRPGISTVYVNLVAGFDRDIQAIWDELRRKITDNASKALPRGVIGPSINDEFGDVFGTIISIYGEDYNYKELYDVADSLRDELLKIDHVGKAKVFGEQEERIFIEFDNNRLASMGISARQVADIISATNIVKFGGTIRNDASRLDVRITGDYKSVEDIENTVIKVPGYSGSIYLRDIATVTRSYKEPASYKAKFNGEKAVMVGLSLKDGKNNIELGYEATRVTNEFKARYPVGLNFEYLAYQPGIVEDKINAFVSNLLQAIITIILVMVLALGFRTGLIVSTLIPVVTCVTFLILKSLNMGLDQMSLAGLIIALGMLVDNSIVMSESIMVMMEGGKGKLEACLDSANDLKGPLLVASLIIVAAFSPIFLAQADIGEYTAPIGIVVAICLLTSWVIANTLIPLLCYQFLKVEPKEVDYSKKLYTVYKGILLTLLKLKKLTALGAIGVFVLGMILFRFIPVKFMPESDKPIMISELRLPVGTAIETTEAIVADIDAFIERELQVPTDSSKKVNPIVQMVYGGTKKEYEAPGILSWGAFIGGGAPRYTLTYSPEAPAAEYAYILYNTTGYKDVNGDKDTVGLAETISNYVKEKYRMVDINTKLLSQGPSAAKEVQYRIRGNDVHELYRITNEVKNKMRSVPGTINVSDNWNEPMKKINVVIDEERAKNSGFTSAEVATSLEAILTGVTVDYYREDDDIIPIVFRTESEFRDSLDSLGTTSIFSADGKRSVALSQVARIEIASEPGFIYTYGDKLTITAQSDVASGYTANEVTKVMTPWLKEQQQNWPYGYDFIIGGEAESSAEASEAINAQLPLAGLLVLLLLIVQFNSLKKPLIILLTIPLGILGTSIGLLLTGNNFGFMPLIGIISLCGVVINAAIVLIDRIDIEIGNGLSPAEAIITACLARIRPILLTTLTTVCGLLPLWFFGGTLFSPMAVALLFGLVFATALTLGVIPALYSIFYKVNFKDYKDK